MCSVLQLMPESEVKQMLSPTNLWRMARYRSLQSRVWPLKCTLTEQEPRTHSGGLGAKLGVTTGRKTSFQSNNLSHLQLSYIWVCGHKRGMWSLERKCTSVHHGSSSGQKFSVGGLRECNFHMFVFPSLVSFQTMCLELYVTSYVWRVTWPLWPLGFCAWSCYWQIHLNVN